MNYELELHPRDVLYFRDGRPIGGSSDGVGSLWPHPALFHSALLAALQRRFADRLGEWESEHHRWTDSERKKHERGRVRFHLGGLKSWGPFPKTDEGILAAIPADLLAQGGVFGIEPVQDGFKLGAEAKIIEGRGQDHQIRLQQLGPQGLHIVFLGALLPVAAAKIAGLTGGHGRKGAIKAFHLMAGGSGTFQEGIH